MIVRKELHNTALGKEWWTWVSVNGGPCEVLFFRSEPTEKDVEKVLADRAEAIKRQEAASADRRVAEIDVEIAKLTQEKTALQSVINKSL